MTAAPDMKPSEALRKARELITPDGAWTQGAFSRRSNGSEPFDIHDGVCFCSLGAICSVTGGMGANYVQARTYLARYTADRPADWNDFPGRTQAEVLDVFRKAEELALSEGR